MSTFDATYSVGALQADPVPARQGVALDVGARSPESVPAGKAFADADLNSAYAILAARFPDEAFSRASIGGPGAGKLQAGLAAALLAVIILMVAMNFSSWHDAENLGNATTSAAILRVPSPPFGAPLD